MVKPRKGVKPKRKMTDVKCPDCGALMADGGACGYYCIAKGCDHDSFKKVGQNTDVKVLHRLYDVEVPKKVLYPIPELITQLLITINMYEGTDGLRPNSSDILVKRLRGVHDVLMRTIGLHPDYQDNDGLRKLDKAYEAAGWDENGLRWTAKDPRDPTDDDDIFIVEFTNREHTTWRFA